METQIVEVISQSLSVTMTEAEWRAVLVEPGKFLKALRADLAGMARERTKDDPRQFSIGRKARPKGKTARARGQGRASTTMTCPICGKVYKNRTSLFEKHMLKHQSADDAAG